MNPGGRTGLGRRTRTGGGRHRSPTSRGRRVLWPAVLVLVLALSGIAGWMVLHRPTDATPVAECAATRVPVQISVSPDLAPVVTAAAQSFDRGTTSMVDGRCTTTKVSAVESYAFGEALRADLAADQKDRAADVSGGATAWIPDASTWREVLAARPELGNALPRIYPIIATTPVVIAAPRPMAEALGWPGRQPSWGQLLELAHAPEGWKALGHPEWGPVRLAWPNVLQDAASAEAMVSLSDHALRDTTTVDEVRRSLLRTQSALASVRVDPQKALEPLTKAGSPAKVLSGAALVPTTEREVITLNRGNPPVPLVALYPSDGVAPIEVPLITVRARWVTAEQQAALDKFAEYLVTGTPAREFAAHGWRTPRLAATETVTVAAIASEPAYTPAAPTTTTIGQALQRWTALDRDGSVLVVLDTSGSMNERVAAAGGLTRLELAKRAITESLPLFSDRTSVGLWTFARRDTGVDYNRVLDLGPLSRMVSGRPAREALQSSLAAVRADGATGLYDTIVAAGKAAADAWRPGDNAIILISDGRNEDPGSATLDQAVARLKPLANPDRQVRILSIALGAQADTAALQRISAATGGEAYVARQSEDLDKVFLAALTR